MLDPTFLYNFDTDIERENIKPKPYRYILIYDCKLTEPMVKQLQEYAKKNDLKIIGAGDYKTFYDEGFIDLTPYEWVDLFRNAEKVITGMGQFFLLSTTNRFCVIQQRKTESIRFVRCYPI